MKHLIKCHLETSSYAEREGASCESGKEWLKGETAADYERGSIGQEKGSLAELVKDQSDSSYLTFSLMT